jgi:hypothetical protein
MKRKRTPRSATPPPEPLALVPVVLAPPPPENWRWRFGFSNIRKKTPTVIKAVGRSLAAVAAYAGSTQFASGHEKLGSLIFGFGIVGAFLTAMFTDEPPAYCPPSGPPSYPGNNPMA